MDKDGNRAISLDDFVQETAVLFIITMVTVAALAFKTIADSTSAVIYEGGKAIGEGVDYIASKCGEIVDDSLGFCIGFESAVLGTQNSGGILNLID